MSAMDESTTGAPDQLGFGQRAHALQRMAAETFDIVVVGGGVVGTGSPLDAATRGLLVALLEARDYAAGTSSRSSKRIHGELRYLEQLEFGLVREALRERSLPLNVGRGAVVTEVAPAVPFWETVPKYPDCLPRNPRRFVRPGRKLSQPAQEVGHR
jgi:glycerol-3-phosphate dehydrogenase